MAINDHAYSMRWDAAVRLPMRDGAPSNAHCTHQLDTRGREKDGGERGERGAGRGVGKRQKAKLYWLIN